MIGFGIKYNNEFLDLAPNQSAEIERNNPMFIIESAVAEYTTAVSFPATNKNVRLLGNIFFDLDAKSKMKYTVELWDKGSVRYNCVLILDKGISNRRYFEKSIVTGFLLIGVSQVYNEMKDRKANSLYYDKNLRFFTFTTFDPFDNSGGYWQHFHDTWNNNADYVIAPIHNDDWYGDNPSFSSYFYNGFMNVMDKGKLIPNSPITIQPRVKYIMRKLVEENGWSFDDSEMAGTDWERLFLVNFAPIQYYFELYTNSQFSQLEINLANCISPELTCADLFFELCKHYGWIPTFDGSSNTCKLFPLKNGAGISGGETVDLTEFATDEVQNDFSGTLKTFSFKNEFPSNDAAVGNVDLSAFKKENPVFKVVDLPPASPFFDLSIVFVYVENKFYKIDLDPTTNTRIWVVAADNIYDADIPDNVETVQSKVTTLPMYRTKYRDEEGGLIKYYGYFPYCKQSQFKEWSIRTLLYLGMATEEKEDGTAGTYTYPQLSSIRCFHDGTEVAMFSNVFNHKNPNTGVDLGIIPYWFKTWTSLTANIEENEEKLLLPIHILRKLKWNDLILLFNIPYLMKSYTEPIPYKGFIAAKLQRITEPTHNVGVPSSGKIYVKLVLRNIVSGQNVVYADWLLGTGNNTTLSNLTTCDVVAEFYSELAAINKLKVVNLTIKWTLINEYNSIADPILELPWAYHNVKEGAFFALTQSGKVELEYDLVNSVPQYPPPPYLFPQDGHYKKIFGIAPSPDYEIIP